MPGQKPKKWSQACAHQLKLFFAQGVFPSEEPAPAPGEQEAWNRIFQKFPLISEQNPRRIETNWESTREQYLKDKEDSGLSDEHMIELLMTPPATKVKKTNTPSKSPKFMKTPSPSAAKASPKTPTKQSTHQALAGCEEYPMHNTFRFETTNGSRCTSYFNLPSGMSPDQITAVKIVPHKTLPHILLTLLWPLRNIHPFLLGRVYKDDIGGPTFNIDHPRTIAHQAALKRVSNNLTFRKMNFFIPLPMQCRFMKRGTQSWVAVRHDGFNCILMEFVGKNWIESGRKPTRKPRFIGEDDASPDK